MVTKNVNYFDELRTFPRDPNELRQHSARLSHILQKRYNIPVDVVKLALQPQNNEEFNRYYRQQVMRIIGNFNAVTQKQLKVRVDPRLAKGMQLVRSDIVVLPTVEAKTQKKRAELPAGAPNAATTTPAKNSSAYMQEIGGFSDPSWGVRAQWTNQEAHLPLTEEQKTPQAASSTLVALKGVCGGSDYMDTVSSDDYSVYDHYSMKKGCREVVFGTPPEFKGFTVPLQTSPADSAMTRSPLLL